MTHRDTFRYTNPYETEIRSFTYSPAQLCAGPEVHFWPIQSKPYHFVDSVPKLEQMCRVLDSVSEFAIDLEVWM